MKRWFRRNFYLNELNNILLNTILFYIVCAIITYFAYKYGIIKTIVLNEIQYEVESIVLAPIVVFIMLYSFMKVAIPPFLGLWLFFEYYKKFSNIEKIDRIVPISNRSKIINMTISIVMVYMFFLVITRISNFSMGVSDDKSLYKIALILSTALIAIIADILSREKKVGDIANLTLIIIAIIISFNVWNLLFQILKEYFNNIILISTISLIIFCVLEFIYILKKIDNIKIN